MKREIIEYAAANDWFTWADVLKKHPQLNRANLKVQLKKLFDDGILKRVARSKLDERSGRFIYKLDDDLELPIEFRWPCSKSSWSRTFKLWNCKLSKDKGPCVVQANNKECPYGRC